MTTILERIYTLDLGKIVNQKMVGRCAMCSKNVSLTESNLLEEFWTHICKNWDENIFIDIQIEYDDLSSDQFNKFNEPLMCIGCLKSCIHTE
jgi:hypothetical protein